LISARRRGKMKGQQLQAHNGPWGSPRSDRGLRWIWNFAPSLLYGRGITRITMGEVKTQPLKGKCWEKRLKILQNP